MIPIGDGFGPRGLAEGGPDGGFFDVASGFVVAGQKADGRRGGGCVDCGTEELGEEVEDGLAGTVFYEGKVCGVGFGTLETDLDMCTMRFMH